MTLSRSYREVMEHIAVTPEMRERILKNLSQAEQKRPLKVVRSAPWRPLLSLAACAAVLLVGSRVLQKGAELGSVSSAAGSGVSIGAPVQEFGSLAELSAAAGFTLQQPGELPFEVTETEYSLLFGELAQVEQKGVDGQSILYRVSQEDADNSGDHNEYDKSEQWMSAGAAVTLKGTENGWHLAVWQKDGFSYSLSASTGLTDAQMRAVLETLLK